MRVTRLDNAGRPISSACAFVVTSGFVSVELGAEVEDGEETTVTNAAGEICVSEKACDQLKWRNVTITFCQVDPDLVQIINPTYKKVVDAAGNTVGWRGSSSLSCDTGYALEIWMDTTNVDNTVIPSYADGVWGYLLLPWVVGGAPGDLTIENGALSFVFNGRTKSGGGWGVGPYDITKIGTAKPAPLATPIAADEDMDLELVYLTPPAAQCGCQTLLGAPIIQDLSKDSTDNTNMTASLTPKNSVDGTGKRLSINWGDGTPTVAAVDSVAQTHQYAAAGTYTVILMQEDSPSTSQSATVPFS
ncbi:PKD domain-containing protein [Nonomuraea sp. NPDC050556]|uniref:PKD domain-containing protein n=1 Tax=Nonomuraea sp. NPDC050556 TaxID=3364369 RepID=UPI003797C060